jgi:epoxyqueuosine reductase
MQYLADRGPEGELLRADPHSVFCDARSVVCVALPYESGVAPLRESSPVSPSQLKDESQQPSSTPLANIARYARHRDYHVVLKDLLLRLADDLAVKLQQTIRSRVCVDSAPLLERDLAVRAGFAFLGKNTLAIAPGVGSYFVLGELLLDIELEPASGFAKEGCGACTACLTACPTQAFVKPFQLDARRCISYLTIESAEPIAPELRGKLSDRVFGCDVCQEVCPYNQSTKRPPVPPDFGHVAQLAQVDLLSLLELTSGEYRRLVQKTALRRVSRNQLARNAAVALGNVGGKEALLPLRRVASSHSSSLVRSHATWALGQLLYRLNLPEARQALVELRGSVDPEVRAEAERCLNSP